jgi:hypothetical protein
LAQVKARGEHDSKWPKDQTVKAENSEDLDRKMPNLARQGALSKRGEIDAKGPHAEDGKF